MLLGIDIGSSGVKAALVDPHEGVLATAQEQVALLSPRPGWAEADPDDWWRAVCSLVPRLLEETGAGRELTIAAVYDHLEVWNRAAWREQLTKAEGSAEDVAERLANRS